MRTQDTATPNTPPRTPTTRGTATHTATLTDTHTATRGTRRALAVARRTPAAGRALAACALFTAGALVLSGCGGDAEADGKGPSGRADAHAPHLTISAKDGSADASINATGVEVTDGRLTRVTMTATATGKAVSGRTSADGTSWHPAEQLERGTEYRIAARATNGDGRTATAKAQFTTVTVAHSYIGTYTPDGGSTVGVGMPVSFTFDKAITDRKAVGKGIKVTSSSGQQVVGHWFGDRRLDFRPQEYWKAGSRVTVQIRLDGVEGAHGIYGVQDKTVTFTVGRSQVSTVDVATQSMQVVRDGRTIRTVPISAGSPEHPTYNGRMVISEKSAETRMKGSTVGFGGEYDIPDVPHAMRLTTSGTYIHGNYWYARGNPPFGRQGTSHGCIGIQDVRGAQADTLAKWFYDHSLIGDVVTVKNSPDATVAPDNGFSDWNMSWAAWKADKG